MAPELEIGSGTSELSWGMISANAVEARSMAFQNGIYAAFTTGTGGQGVAFLVFSRGTIVGTDIGGFKYDGTVEEYGAGHRVKLLVSTPPNQMTVQGVNTGPNGIAYNLDFLLPDDYERLPFVRVETPVGPVNFRLQLLRDLGKLALG